MKFVETCLDDVPHALLTPKGLNVHMMDKSVLVRDVIKDDFG
jgi:hypothetical protein